MPIDKFANMFLLKTYNATYESDFICMSEVYLNSSVSSDHVSLDLEGYNLARADHPDNVKPGWICIYYQKSLRVRVIDLHIFNRHYS